MGVLNRLFHLQKAFMPQKLGTYLLCYSFDRFSFEIFLETDVSVSCFVIIVSHHQEQIAEIIIPHMSRPYPSVLFQWNHLSVLHTASETKGGCSIRPPAEFPRQFHFFISTACFIKCCLCSCTGSWAEFHWPLLTS